MEKRVVQNKFGYEDQCRESVQFTHLMRKNVAGDLVGNNVRIICEDVVQNRAVILPWNKMKRKSEARRAAESLSVCATGRKLISSRSQKVAHVMCSVLNYIISPTFSPPLAFICSYPSSKVTFIFLTTG